jgi:hypothetical protein
VHSTQHTLLETGVETQPTFKRTAGVNTFYSYISEKSSILGSSALALFSPQDLLPL